MNRVETFTLRVSPEERRAIAELAMHLQRSQSDAVRYIVVETVKQFSKADPGSAAQPAEDTQYERGNAYVTE